MSSPEAYPEHPTEGPGFALIAQFIGAFLSLALAIGIGVWAYKLIMRDVSGIPVIAASSDPMRIAPEDPGGTSAQNQGLSVNAVAEEGSVTNPQKVTLAPRPVVLVTDDLASKELKQKATEALRVSNIETTSLDMNVLADEIVGDSPEPSIADVQIDGNQVENALRLALSGEIEQEAEDERQSAASLRPRARPSDISPAPNSVELASVQEIAPENIPAGTALVQLGAFDSEAIARTEWMRLSQKFPSFMAERSRVIQRADRGGRIFYRLRADGFADLNDARRFCALLVASNADCIPVTVR
ncbi:MAG: SPOR domain-containing protein [Rhodobacteraceae bacterium]|nr:SPOR domain-containing protein [Paracoccaceae bacterium]